MIYISKLIQTDIEISQADYYELNSKESRWTVDEYAYWVAKLKGACPAEGYGLYNPYTYQKDGKYYITWKHYDSCD